MRTRIWPRYKFNKLEKKTGRELAKIKIKRDTDVNLMGNTFVLSHYRSVSDQVSIKCSWCEGTNRHTHSEYQGTGANGNDGARVETSKLG